MAAHERLKNEFTADEKCHNLMSWLISWPVSQENYLGGLGLDFVTPGLKSDEPPHDKTNKVACAPSEYSEQPGHATSLIRIFAVCMKKPGVHSYPLSKDSDQTGLSLRWAPMSFCWFCHEAAQTTNLTGSQLRYQAWQCITDRRQHCAMIAYI